VHHSLMTTLVSPPRSEGSTAPSFAPEVTIMYEAKVRVEIRKETAPHHRPHMHVTHSDQVDASIALDDFETIAGKIDGKVFRNLKKKLLPRKAELLELWKLLHSDNVDIIEVEKIVNMIRGRSR
jgi:hypothetical protein